ncbi:MAG: flagellar biosynthetic protein FliR [Treponema sp.]|nr:flagellar biosynthetic protein FliR [Treponema sp.]
MNDILVKAPVYLLIFARCFTMILTLPLFSMRTVPRIAKVTLAGYMAFFLFSTVDFTSYQNYLTDDGVFSFEFILLLAGEALIGIILGFYITIIFSAFSSAGQFTAFQMGFSAASTYDALAQIENPLMGQFFNFIAILIFFQTKWFQILFFRGLKASFDSISVLSLVEGRDHLVKFLLSGLSNLFADALIISLPIMGSLLLITVCTGLLSKAAPQMNLLSEGFPVMILVAFFIIMTILPNLCDFFIQSFASGFKEMENLFIQISGGV